MDPNKVSKWTKVLLLYREVQCNRRFGWSLFAEGTDLSRFILGYSSIYQPHVIELPIFPLFLDWLSQIANCRPIWWSYQVNTPLVFCLYLFFFSFKHIVVNTIYAYMHDVEVSSSVNDDTPNKKFHAQQKYESQLATVTFMISNENENQKMCTIPIVWIWLKWLSDATILHIDF